ncbi:MAG: hypothetical protein L3V56_08895 [Candidatus Magnetoovum sp. WYHC-5]|nr:hypothetical protein [Candidatus Magnetoovum sp. WYHC-5]
MEGITSWEEEARFSMSKKTERLAEEISKQTGIDFKKYRNEEIIEQIQNVTSFIISPASIIPTIIKPLIFILAIFNITAIILYASINDTSVLGMVIFLVIGNILNILIGITLGVRLSMKSILDDTKSIVNYTIETSNKLAKDFTVNTETIGDIIQGVSYCIIIPSVEKIIADKFMFLSRPISFIACNSIYHFTKNLSHYASKLPRDNSTVDAPISIFEIVKNRIDIASGLVIPKLLFPTNLLLYILLVIDSVALFVIYKVLI